MRTVKRCLMPSYANTLTMVFLAVAGVTSFGQEAIAGRQAAENSPAQVQPIDSSSEKVTPKDFQPESLPDSPSSVLTQIAASNRLQSGVEAVSTEQQNGTHKPVGTAAAKSIPATGVAASNPSGAAIAPVKQRRVRSILIKVGALVGAGAAVGTVVALSSASPSRPPGSH